jgi:DNA primase
MARFTNESLGQLRERINLEEVLSQHIQLKRAGSGFKALCPFHDEKSPSFVLNKGDTHFHCFGCGAHGDAIGFLMQHLKLSFNDAVQQLAERFGVTLEVAEGKSEEKGIARVRVKDALDAACRYYQASLLHTEEGHQALSYLFKRSIPLEFLYAFRVGFASKQSGLRSYLHNLGFRDEELAAAGLLSDRNREFFYDRITFPILDPAGAVIGFSARKFKEATTGGKYINSRETMLFKKSKVLFGLHQSRKKIIKQKQAIIVEGGVDALQMIFHGFDLTVAALGTAFGQDHVQELVQLGVTRVFLLFDGDEAGQAAAVKVGHLFQKKSIEVLVAVLGKGKDPDSALAKEGAVSITKALVHARDYLSFLYDQIFRGISKDSPAEKQRALQEIVQRIREWDSSIMVHESLKKLASLASVPQELLGVGTVSQPSLYAKKASTIAKPEVVDPDRIVETDLLRWLILCGYHNKKVIELCEQNIDANELRQPLIRHLFQNVLQTLKKNEPIDFVALVQECEEEGVEVLISEILAKKINRDKANGHLVETIKRIKERNWILQREEIKMRIQSGDLSEDEQLALVKEFDLLSKSAPKVIQESV